MLDGGSFACFVEFLVLGGDLRVDIFHGCLACVVGDSWFTAGNSLFSSGGVGVVGFATMVELSDEELEPFTVLDS